MRFITMPNTAHQVQRILTAHRMSGATSSAVVQDKHSINVTSTIPGLEPLKREVPISEADPHHVSLNRQLREHPVTKGYDVTFTTVQNPDETETLPQIPDDTPRVTLENGDTLTLMPDDTMDPITVIYADGHSEPKDFFSHAFLEYQHAESDQPGTPVTTCGIAIIVIQNPHNQDTLIDLREAYIEAIKLLPDFTDYVAGKHPIAFLNSRTIQRVNTLATQICSPYDRNIMSDLLTDMPHTPSVSTIRQREQRAYSAIITPLNAVVPKANNIQSNMLHHALLDSQQPEFTVVYNDDFNDYASTPTISIRSATITDLHGNVVTYQAPPDYDKPPHTTPRFPKTRFATVDSINLNLAITDPTTGTITQHTIPAKHYVDSQDQNKLLVVVKDSDETERVIKDAALRIDQCDEPTGIKQPNLWTDPDDWNATFIAGLTKYTPREAMQMVIDQVAQAAQLISTHDYNILTEPNVVVSTSPDGRFTVVYHPNDIQA